METISEFWSKVCTLQCNRGRTSPVPPGGILPTGGRLRREHPATLPHLRQPRKSGKLGPRVDASRQPPGPLLPCPRAMPGSSRPPATRRSSRTYPRTLANQIRASPLRQCEGGRHHPEHDSRMPSRLGRARLGCWSRKHRSGARQDSWPGLHPTTPILPTHRARSA